jgi:deazaflavin-dependent oxidoreductase (nitroreductase family)
MDVRRLLAVFNRSVANHFFGPVMTRFSAFGVVHHRGRKSGREYETPVKVFRRGDGYVISLPYGSTCDWVRNVLAERACELEIRDRTISLVEPTVYHDQGEADIPTILRFILRRLGVTEYLAMKPAPSPLSLGSRVPSPSLRSANSPNGRSFASTGLHRPRRNTE